MKESLSAILASQVREEPVEQRILFALRRITHGIDTYSRKLRTAHDITLPQLVCLRTIAEDGPLMQSAVGRRVALSPSTMVGIIDRLERRGLVARERGSRDRRQVHVRATDEGRRLAAELPSPLHDRLAAALQALPSPEQAAIAFALEKIVKLMESQDLVP